MTNVLILEDNPAIASVLEVIAQRLGISYMHFITPSDAIREDAISKADFIITDFEMPPENALILLDYLKKNNIKKPVIMYSGYTSAKEEVLENGYGDLVNEYLDKPAELKQIMNVFNKYINK